MDNHESQVSIAAITKARENGIINLTFPTHKATGQMCLRILLKKYYNAACSNLMLTKPRKQISISNVGHMIGVAYPSAFNTCKIESEFRVSDLRPVNADIFRDYEYLNSYVTDRREPTDPLTAPETHQASATNINVSLYPLETDQLAHLYQRFQQAKQLKLLQNLSKSFGHFQKHNEEDE
jgi:hypothetical protein